MLDKMTTALRRLLLSLACTASAANGSHALTLYSAPPNYPTDVRRFDYDNPESPKRGTLRLSAFGSFDSFNGFISRGTAADQLGLIYDTLTVHSLDEPFTEYGLIAHSMEQAEDNT